MSIISIDPGTSNTGVVYMDGRRIIDVLTIHYEETVKQDQRLLWMRAHDIATQIGWFASKRPHDLVVIEGFVGYTGRQGGYTYQTPYLVGYLHRFLDGEPFEIQTSRQVLNSHVRGSAVAKGESKAQALERWGWDGIEQLRNDHLRSAALHGIYYYNHKEEATDEDNQ